MKLAQSRAWLPSVLFVALVGLFPSSASRAEDGITPEVFRRVTDVLAGRRVAQEEEWSLGTRTRAPSVLRELVRRTVRAVPFVVSGDSTGSSVVVAVNPAESVGWLITNHHVVKQAFRTDKGTPYVLLFFYEPQLAAEPFDREQLAQCANGHQRTTWCAMLLRSLRTGIVVGTDPDRDLALLAVPDLPGDVQLIPEIGIETVEPGDDVALISHPRRLLWTLTVGIVSAVRSRYPMGRALGTVIQTQTPTAPGSSGGPLLTPQGRLLGIVAWAHEEQGLNGAIAINEVQAFASEQARKFRAR